MICKKNNSKKFLLLFLILSFLGLAGFASALELQYPEVFGLSLGSDPSLADYAKYFFNAGIFIAVTLAGIIIAYGGILFLVDYARGKFASEGKEWVKAGAAGLLLTVCAYLILYTINPALVVLDLKGLAPLTYLANILNPSSNSSLPTEIYNEIPIGTLTENLLAREIDCYDYDEFGDPIDGTQITTDDNQKIIGPTYLEHDRADCTLKLAKAIESKTKVVNELSDELVSLMNTCDCSLSSGGTGVSGTTTEGTATTIGPSGTSTTGGGTTSFGTSSTSGYIYCENKTCSKTVVNKETNETADCRYPSATCNENTIKNVGSETPCKDSCSDNSCQCSNTKKCDRCPEGTKDKIDGTGAPVCLNYFCSNIETSDLQDNNDYQKANNSDEKCDKTQKSFLGMKEFQSEYNNNYEQIKQIVELQNSPTYNKKALSIIQDGNCTLCDITCSSGDNACEKKLIACQAKRKQCLMNNSPWYKLRLVDQLAYLMGKLDEIKQKVKSDVENLQKAETELGKCYLADSYVSFFNTYEKTDKEKTTIVVKQTYTDSDTQNFVNPAKYCKGYQYDNSSCYSQCQKVCPGTQKDEYEKYKNVKTCDSSKITDAGEMKKCLQEQSKAMQEYYNNRTCVKGASPYSTFNECFAGCQQNCLDSCETNLCDSDSESDDSSKKSAKETCQEKCKNNSQCILNNQDKCLVDFNKLQTCAVNANGNLEYFQSCASQAALCAYCSDQYAGYPECMTTETSSNYSSSYIYRNPNSELCTYNEVISTGNNKSVSTCVSLYPQTTKCPSNSKCPQCPCGTNGDYTNSDYLTTIASSSSSSSSSSNTTTTSTLAYTGENASTYRMCSGQCDYFSYNDDPLTFYCNQSWWTKEEASKETPAGEEKICPANKEIPMGRTVDNSEKWGNEFIAAIEKFSDKAQEEMDYITKIGEEKKYCECGSKCDEAGTEPTCKAKCIFEESKTSTDTTSSSSSSSSSSGGTGVSGTTTEGTATTIGPSGTSTTGGGTTSFDISSSSSSSSSGGSEGSYTYKCSCQRQSCSGQPCQKIINMLNGKESSDECPKGTEYKGVKFYSDQTATAASDFAAFLEGTSRSEALKELNYSRTTTDNCSVTENNYATQVELMSCTRVEDEIISPVVDTSSTAVANSQSSSSYCYGKELGKIVGSSDNLMDNWFCCEVRKIENQTQ